MDNSHVDLDLLPVLALGRLDVKGPENPRNVDGYGSSAEVHPRTDAAAPAKGAVAEGAGVLALLGEALRSELVGLGEVGFV